MNEDPFFACIHHTDGHAADLDRYLSTEDAPLCPRCGADILDDGIPDDDGKLMHAECVDKGNES